MRHGEARGSRSSAARSMRRLLAGRSDFCQRRLSWICRVRLDPRTGAPAMGNPALERFSCASIPIRPGSARSRCRELVSSPRREGNPLRKTLFPKGSVPEPAQSESLGKTQHLGFYQTYKTAATRKVVEGVPTDFGKTAIRAVFLIMLKKNAGSKHILTDIMFAILNSWNRQRTCHFSRPKREQACGSLADCVQ